MVTLKGQSLCPAQDLTGALLHLYSGKTASWCFQFLHEYNHVSHSHFPICWRKQITYNNVVNYSESLIEALKNFFFFFLWASHNKLILLCSNLFFSKCRINLNYKILVALGFGMHTSELKLHLTTSKLSNPDSLSSLFSISYKVKCRGALNEITSP